MKKDLKKPPKIAEKMLNRFLSGGTSYSAIGDYSEMYNHLIKINGIFFARFWYRLQVVKALIVYLRNNLAWNFSMFKNYLVVAVRNIIKDKTSSLINTAGLAVGFACCILIFLYVSFHYGYDKYYQNSSRIYRIWREYKTEKFQEQYATTPIPLIPHIKNNYPEVEEAVQLELYSNQLVRNDDNIDYENRVVYTDPDIFKIFSIPFVRGNPAEAFGGPESIIITEKIACKYFADGDAFGKILNVRGKDFIVNAIIKDSPLNTHFKYNMFIPLENIRSDFSNWSNCSMYSYVKLAASTDPAEFEKKILELSREQYGKPYLQKITDIHLRSKLSEEIEPSMNPQYLYVFSVIGFFILLVACINYINLLTARSSNRAKEIGVKKVMGADRALLIKQFLGESMLITTLSFLASLIIIGAVLPLFNDIVNTRFTFADILRLNIILPLIGLVFITGICAGSYPAFFLSKFNPATALKVSSMTNLRGSVLRKTLVICQFAVSVILIISALLIFKQLQYMKNADPGFEKEQKLIVAGDFSKNYKTLKSELLKEHSLTGAAVSNSVPGRFPDYWGTGLIGKENVRLAVRYLFVDFDFFSEYKLKIIAGRSFDEKISTDLKDSFVINESAVKAFGWSTPDEALGKKIRTGFGLEGKITGVLKDFHYFGLQTEIEPFVFFIHPREFRYMTLTVNISDLKNTISYVERTWNRFFPGDIFRYFFLDTDFNRQYISEEKLGKIFGIFAFLGIFIAAIGVFGLASFLLEQRTREIGVRKILGASTYSILSLFSVKFLKLVLMSNLIAWPIAGFLMTKWLHNFAYQTKMGWSVFVLSGLSALLITIVTVFYQSLKAVKINSVEAISRE